MLMLPAVVTALQASITCSHVCLAYFSLLAMSEVTLKAFYHYIHKVLLPKHFWFELFLVFVTCSTTVPAGIKGIEKRSTIYTNIKNETQDDLIC